MCIRTFSRLEVAGKIWGGGNELFLVRTVLYFHNFRIQSKL